MKRIATPALALLAVIAAISGLWLNSSGQEAPALIAGLTAMVLTCAAAVSRDALAGGAVTAAVAAAVSAYLTLQHGSPGESACDIDEVFNCGLVNSSSFSELAGIPIALFGLAFYIAMALLAAGASLDRPKMQRAPVLYLAGALLSCVMALYLAWASTTLGAWCLFCVSTYALDVVMVVAGWAATERHGFTDELGAALTGKDDDASMARAVIVGLLTLGLGAALTSGGGPASVESAAEADIGQLYQQPAGELRLSGNEPIWGHPDAPYLLVEFADYECPYCALMAKEIKDVVSRHPELAVAHKHYPLSNLCNPKIGSEGHRNACMAAAAAVCAQEQGRFWELNDRMFRNQEYLSAEDIRFMGEQLGLDTGAFESCMAADTTTQRVLADIKHGEAAGVRSTPSLYLRGAHGGDDWIHITMGAEGLELILQALAAGEALPAPRPPSDDR